MGPAEAPAGAGGGAGNSGPAGGIDSEWLCQGGDWLFPDSLFVSLGSYRDSEAKIQECKKKKALIEEAIEKQRRIEAEMREREEKKRREEEKTIVMEKCSLRLILPVQSTKLC